MRTKVVFKRISNILATPWVRHAVAITALIFALISISSLSADILQSDVSLFINSSLSSFLLIVAVATVASLLRSERLHQLIRVNTPGVSRRFSYISFMYGLLLSFTPAKSAELLRFSHGPEINQVSLWMSARIFFLEKLTDIVAIGLIVCAVLIDFWVLLLLLLGGILISPAVEANILGVRDVTTGRATIGAVAFSAISWVIEGIILYFMLEHLTQPNLTLPSVIAGFSLASLVGAISFIPGGILVSEITFLKLIESSSGSLFAVVLIFRTIILLTNLLIGLGAWYLLRSKPQLFAILRKD